MTAKERPSATDPARSSREFRALRLQRLDLAAVIAGDPDARREHAALVRRGAVPDPTIRESARRTLAAVRAGGDAAVRSANESFGGGRPDGRLVLDPDDLRAARDRLSPRIRRALDQAIANVRTFAETQRPATVTTTISPGIEIERRWSAARPRRCVRPRGVGAVPVVAGDDRRPGTGRRCRCDRRRLARGSCDGETNPVLLGAAGLLEIDAFVVAGGAQAIGALAFGLPEAGLEPVERIVGPGNAWVTAAKIEVVGEVGIDLPAGPSEGMVLAAPPADPARVAADLITQAEHGPDFARDPGHDRRDVRDGRRGGRQPGARGRRATRHPGRRAAPARPDRPRPDPRRGDRVRQRLRARAPVGRCRAARAHDRAPSERRVDLRRPVGARVGRRLRHGRQPRPADGRSRPRVRCPRGRGLREVHPGPADHPRGPRRRSARRSARWPRRRASWPTATRSRSASGTTPDEPDRRDLQHADAARRRTPGRRPTTRSPHATASTARPSSGST